ncbi:methyl-accepting chemotaxis protein, partial [Ruminococcaceae bacterium OttesenSCG-928-D13]|nr:methyl-accepting chemotaxis protein [Ruminococcaceae bacterium OttesenSCG-928-D13]
LIEDSQQRVTEGTGVVEQTNTALAAVADLAGQTSELVTGISAESAQQSQSISELSIGLDQISQVVQGNSATAEESAASAQEMNAQATLLERMVAQFKLPGIEGAPARAALPAHPDEPLF